MAKTRFSSVDDYIAAKPKEARTWFQQASEYPNEKKAALGWLQHIDSEQNSGR